MNRPVATTALILLGASLITVCSLGTLWFDEILSLQWARSAKTPWQLLELYRHDNNHPLNSLWLMIVGEGRPPWAYRLLSIVSGILSLFLIHRISLQLSSRFAWVPLLLAATSFPLVLYASEARGYSPAIACLLGAYAVLTGRGKAAWRIPVFWALCILSLLSHGTALFILAATGTASLIKEILKKQNTLTLIKHLAVWFAPPLFASFAYMHFFLQKMMVAGGPEYPIPLVLAHFFGYAFGIPGAGSGSLAITVGGLTILTAALALARFPEPATRWFFIGAIIVFPGLSLFAADTTYLYFRYFLVCLPFVYLLAAPVAERIAECGRPAATIAISLCLASIAGQTPRLWALATLGRGSYFNALQEIATAPTPCKFIASNNDMQVGFVVGHFRLIFSWLEPLQFVSKWTNSQKLPRWILYTSQEDPPVAPLPTLELNGKFYNFVSFHRSAPVSGAHWALYEIQNTNP